MVIDRKHLAPYSDICGAAAGATLPIAYPHILAMPLHLAMLGAEAFPVKLFGLVHVQNRIAMREPLSADEPAEIRCWIEGHRDTERGQEFDLHTEYVVAGEPLLGRDLHVPRAQARAARAPAKTTISRAPSKARRMRWRSSRAAFARRPGLGRRYGFISGDVNPIHMSDLTARAFGFPRAIAHGMWSLGRLASDFEAEQFDGGCELNVNFKLPIYMPAWLMLQRWDDRERLGVRAARRAGRKAASHRNPEIAAVSARRAAVPVGREERRALLTAAAGFFCLLCGYYMLRPMREALALEVGVAIQLASCSRVVFVVLRGAAAHLLVAGGAHAARRACCGSCHTPFAAGVPRAGARAHWYAARPHAGVRVFRRADLGESLLISVFWSAMADVWRPELAKRFYGYVAAGGSAGAHRSARHRARPGARTSGRRRSSSWPARSSWRRRRWSSLARAYAAPLRRTAARCPTAPSRSAAAPSTT